MAEFPPLDLDFLNPYGLPRDVWERYASTLPQGVTAPLKEWFNDHRQKPYTTKAERMLLAIITKMTLNQVSTWFANARRRQKKADEAATVRPLTDICRRVIRKRLGRDRLKRVDELRLPLHLQSYLRAKQ